VAVIQIFAYYVGQRNSSKAGSATLKLIAVIVLAFVWFSNSSYFLNTLNKLSNEVQGVVMSAGTFIADEQVEEGNELEGSQALMRNRSFDLLVYKPYLQMNYDTTSEDVVMENNEDGTHRINDLLALKQNEEGLKERQKIAKREVDELGNMSMSSSNTGGKVGIAITSIFLAILLGIPLVVISMVNLILQIIALTIAVVLPISFIISFLPSFSNSGIYTLGKLVGVFLMKVFVGLLLLFTFLLIEITQTLISTENVGLYMLNVLVTGVLLIFMLMKRDKIIEFITAGRVSNVDGGISRASEKTKEKVKEGSKVAARKTASATGKTAKTAANMAVGVPTHGAFKAGINARNRLEDRKNLRNQQRFEDKQKELGNLVDMNEFKEKKQEEGNQPVQPHVTNQGRENMQRTEQDSPLTRGNNEQEKEGKQSRNVRVNNISPLERKNRNTQPSLTEKENNQPKLDNKRNTSEQLRQNGNTKDINKQRKQARTAQVRHNNPNNTPVTQWEANREIAAHKEVRNRERTSPKKNGVKNQGKNSNRIRNRSKKRNTDN
ncbi:CD3337/EF1877 family mobilome membrane protein, partial [Virgibacillus salexigens]|uniref:CD3337/EF1877 family mobilome membrane protein n=1 Tax=Virgibacillus kapii TaxID=1638645 RepID=UPI001663F8CB